MAYKLEYEQRPGYLIVHVSGDRTLEAVIQVLGEVAHKASQLKVERVLVDVRDFAGGLKTMEDFTLVNEEFSRFRGRGIRKVAILDRVSSNTSNLAFFENVARNRGFNLRMHTEMEAAVGWLVEDKHGK